VVKTEHGLATVLGSSWITVCDGWHPDKRRYEEEVRVLTTDGSIEYIYAYSLKEPVLSLKDEMM